VNVQDKKEPIQPAPI